MTTSPEQVKLAPPQNDDSEPSKLVKRDKKGKFVQGVSGNPKGRPKGSKNKITLLKMAAEEAVREDNYDAMLEVCRRVIQEALNGDSQCRKLVWESMVTRGVAPGDGKQAVQPAINITVASDKPAEIHDITPIEGEFQDEQAELGRDEHEQGSGDGQ